MSNNQVGEKQKQYRQFFKRAKKNTVLKQLPALHQSAFAATDCLSCAACCRNYSPRFKTPDIKRIAKTLRLRESTFIDTYLQLDEEGDYVTQTLPCPFLGADNLCSIYDERPSDCRRFPYTNEDVFIKRQAISLKNATFCPAVQHVLDRLCTM